MQMGDFSSKMQNAATQKGSCHTGKPKQTENNPQKIHPPYLNLSYSSYMYKFTNPSGTAMVQVPLPTNPRTAEPWRLLAVLRVLQSVPRS
jgi:hypothetical protein